MDKIEIESNYKPEPVTSTLIIISGINGSRHCNKEYC